MKELTNFSKRLKYAINNRFTNQRRVSLASNTDETLMSHYCSGKKKPSDIKLIKICRVLNCSPKWVRDGIGSPNDEFNDYIFEEVANNPISNSGKFMITKGSNDNFQLNIVIPKEEMQGIFDNYLKII